jgi:ComF family protein
MLKHLKNWLFNLLFPSQCLGCGQENNLVCALCLKKLALNLHKSYQTPEVKKIYPLFNWYHGLVQKIIHELKFRYAQVILDDLKPALNHAQSQIAKLEKALLVPVPLHRLRLYERGFNQSEIIASCLIETNHQLSLEKNLIKRLKNTLPQSTLSGKSRILNVQNAFQINSQIAKNYPESTKVFLIDDVASTNSTLNECAKALKKGGFTEIYALVLAGGQNKKP